MEKYDEDILIELNNLLFDRYEDVYVELMEIILKERKENDKKEQLKKIENVLGISINQLRELLK